MTFTEAAAEVLRLVGRPLHYKDITEIAIQKNLLSHVGKAPDETMVARLTTQLKKSPKENPLVRLQPGVFALRSWKSEPPGPSPDCDLPPPYGPGPKKEKKEAPAAKTAERREGRNDRGRGRSRAGAAAPVAAEAGPEAAGVALAPAEAGSPAHTLPEEELAEEEALAAAEATSPGHNDEPLDHDAEAPAAEETMGPSDDELDAADQADLNAAAIHDAEEPEEVTRRISLASPVPPAVASQGDEGLPLDALADAHEQAEADAADPPAPAPAAPAEPAHAKERGDRRRDDGRGKPPHGQRPRRDRNHPEAPAAEEEAAKPAPDEQLRADLAAGAIEVFGEEDDDDQPILGGEPASEPGGRRRRRRRRGRGAEAGRPELDSGLPSYTVSPAFGEGGSAEARPEARTEARSEARPEARGDERREGRGEARGGDERRGEGRSEARGEGRGEGREAREAREGRGENRGEGREGRGEDRREERGSRGDSDGEGEEVVGRDMVDLLLNALGGFERSGGPVPLRNVADALLRRGRLSGDAGQVVSMLGAAARADNLRRTSEGKRPRFRLSGGKVALTDWSLSQDLLRLEGEALAAVERYRDASRKAMARKLGELPGHAFVEVCITVLERLGVSQLKAVKRPGSLAGEVQLTGVQRGPGGEVKVAALIRKDAREIGRERVIEARGSLHHFAPATTLWMITSGQVLSGAREEAQAAGAAPVALLDGVGLARLCEEHGLGVVKATVALALPDLEFFEALRGS